MARMYSKARGRSGSKKPDKKVPAWASYKEKEVEKLIIKYGKAGKTPSQIGMILRDSYGINSVKALTNKKVTHVLSENKLGKELPEDLLALIKKMIAVKHHLEKNKQDKTALHGLQLTDSRIRRLIRYYKETKRLPAEWEFDSERLKMYLE